MSTWTDQLTAFRSLARRRRQPELMDHVEIARRRAAEAGDAVEFFRHDVLQQPLPDRFDVVMCSLFLHHLDEADAVAVLRSMVASASRAVLINDLIRSRSGYLLACFGAR